MLGIRLRKPWLILISAVVVLGPYCVATGQSGSPGASELAFSRFVGLSEYRDQAYAFARKHGASDADAEDFAQNVMLKLLSIKDKAKLQSNRYRWTVIRNAWTEHVKPDPRKGQVHSVDPSSLDEIPDSSDLDLSVDKLLDTGFCKFEYDNWLNGLSSDERLVWRMMLVSNGQVPRKLLTQYLPRSRATIYRLGIDLKCRFKEKFDKPTIPIVSLGRAVRDRPDFPGRLPGTPCRGGLGAGGLVAAAPFWDSAQAEASSRADTNEDRKVRLMFFVTFAAPVGLFLVIVYVRVWFEDRRLRRLVRADDKLSRYLTTPMPGRYLGKSSRVTPAQRNSLSKDAIAILLSEGYASLLPSVKDRTPRRLT